MGLTSGLFGWSVILLTAAAFAGVVLLWPRVAGARPVQVAARTGMLIGVNLLVLLTAAVQLNDQFLFFADWTDLGGALGGGTTTSTLHGGGTASQAAGRPVQGAGLTAPAILEPLPPGTPVQGGVTSYPVTGPRSGVTATVLITLPPGYDPRAGAAYPVLETFHGYPGTPAQWVRTMHLQSQIATQVAAHRLRDMIIVSPELEVPPGKDTECVDGGSGGGAQLETFVTRDVPDWVAAHFRVGTGRASWATIGLSAGAWCAAMAAMLHPAVYGGAIVMGGYFRPEFGPDYDPFPSKSAALKRYDLVALAHTAPPPLALWVETSHADPVSYSSSAALLKTARSPLSVTAKVLQNAGHRTSVWEDLLPDALAWLGASLPGFGPAAAP